MIAYSVVSDSRIQRYSRALLERGDSVEFIGLSKKVPQKYKSTYPIPQYTLFTRNQNEKSVFSYLMPFLAFLILSTIKCTLLYFKKRYDIIHYHNIPDFGIFCTIIPKLMGAKVILDIHDLVPEFYMRKFSVSENHVVIHLLKWIEKISASYADHVITVTDIWRQRLIERSVSPDKCKVILNAPDPLIFNQMKRKEIKNQNRFTISYHGNLTEPTGVDIAIKAVAIARKQIPDISFKIFGYGREYERLLNLRNSLDVNDAVVFKKPVPNEYISKLLTDGIFAAAS